MGRKAETGISYYQMRCEHISNKKVKLLIHDHDSDGYWVWQCILAYGYKKRGYYFDLSDPDELILFAEDDCKKPIDLVKQIITSCLNRGLFNKEIHKKYNILTSDHMQETYLFATAERRRKGTVIEFTEQYLLIDISEDIKNVSISKLGIVPRNNYSEGDVVDTIEEESAIKQLKKSYANLEKNKRNIYEFIKKNTPSFIEPYKDMWNVFAIENHKPQISSVTKKREQHFNSRLREKQFDFLKILAKAKQSAMCLESGWFTFDFLIKNTDGYVKLLEGNYDNKLESAQKTTVNTNSTDERLKKALEQQTQ